MKNHVIIPALLFLLMLAACGPGAEQRANYAVIPLPQDISITSEDGFKLTSSTKIAYPMGDKELENDARLLAEYIGQMTGLDLKLTTSDHEMDVIRLSADLKSENREAYRITVDADAILIQGASAAGVFYGIQTIRKSIPEQKKSTVMFPTAVINDEPRFAYRGAHLDVCRHFFPVDSVKTFIDMMALHNMNTFHWHLTEDQGWRIEIKSRPKLAELGSRRAGTCIGEDWESCDSIPVEGYYTQDEVRDIIKYAADRHITVVPEIDLPGHMLGALKAYPELGCTGGPYEVWTRWGVSEDVLCAGNDETYDFLKDVLTEVADLFPSEYIHIGGDECPKTRWAECAKCQAKIRELGLKGDEHGSKEEKLQSHVIKFASEFLASKGKKTIGWDEILEGGLAPGAVVMSWRGEGGGIQAAKMDHDVIMTPNTYLYFDYCQGPDPQKEPVKTGGNNTVQRVYGYEPVPQSLNDEEAKHIMGVQANTWTEHIPTFDLVQYMTLPRFAALAEVQWADAPKNYKGFMKRIPQLTRQYDANGWRYAKHVFDISAAYTADGKKHTVTVDLSTPDDAEIRYTTDGTEPSKESALYEQPLTFSKTTALKGVAFRSNGTSETFSDTIHISKATGCEVTFLHPLHSRYTAKGGATLTDGRFGSNNYSGGDWVGIVGDDLTATIDLGAPQEVSDVKTRVTVNTGDWVFDARGMTVLVSEDGKDFREVASAEYGKMKEHVQTVVPHELKFKPVKARYVRVVLHPEMEMPEWHWGAGKPAFVFADEILID